VGEPMKITSLSLIMHATTTITQQCAEQKQDICRYHEQDEKNTLKP